MTVVHVPFRLRLATLMLYISIPMISIELLIMSRSTTDVNLLKKIIYWAFAFLMICIPLASWVAHLKKGALHLVGALAVIWTCVSGWIAFKMQYPPLAFFTIFLAAFWLGELVWLNYETTRSFLDPQLFWYQGLPKPIPGLKCTVPLEDNVLEMRVSRIDKEGAFLFFSKGAQFMMPAVEYLQDQAQWNVTFSFRDQQIQCFGIPVLWLANQDGIGVQFGGLSADLRKDIGDFIEVLRGEGYV